MRAVRAARKGRDRDGNAGSSVRWAAHHWQMRALHSTSLTCCCPLHRSQSSSASCLWEPTGAADQQQRMSWQHAYAGTDQLPEASYTTVWQASAAAAAGQQLTHRRAARWSMAAAGSKRRLSVHCKAEQPVSAAQHGLRFLQSVATPGAPLGCGAGWCSLPCWPALIAYSAAYDRDAGAFI